MNPKEFFINLSDRNKRVLLQYTKHWQGIEKDLRQKMFVALFLRYPSPQRCTICRKHIKQVEKQFRDENVPDWMNKRVKSINNKQRRIENWKNSEEGKWMLKHCLKQYYDTLQLIK